MLYLQPRFPSATNHIATLSRKYLDEKYTWMKFIDAQPNLKWPFLFARHVE